jgi:5,10-methylenetetrahydromethanopterin reductase
LVELHGWQEEAAAIRATFRSAQPDGIADHVSDDMLWSIAICGNSGQAREMLSARKKLPDLAFSSPPSFLVGRRRRARYDAAAIALMSQRR